MNNKKHQIISELAAYLEAWPKQVNTWDRSVIEHLLANPEILHRFRSGNEAEKWQIYKSIRYASP